MSANAGQTITWVKVAQSITSPVENVSRTEVGLDNYYLVVRFEVNRPAAFVDDVHDLAIDYGHAFFYLVKNFAIVAFFSFGPDGLGKLGWFDKGGTQFGRNAYNVGAFKKDGYINSRPGTPDYPISEIVKAFRMPLSLQQARALKVKVGEIRSKILRGEVMYSALINDTCAETAKQILDDADIPTPSGSGSVKHSAMLNFPVAYAVNPYKWHKNFKKQYKEKKFKFGAGKWLPSTGEIDPVFDSSDIEKGDSMHGAAS
jgi:hypothetical protein